MAGARQGGKTIYYGDSADNFDSHALLGTDNWWVWPDFNLLRYGYDGESLAQWTEKWFTWAWQAPASENPMLDTTGAYASVDNNGPVFFIAGTTSSVAQRF